MKMKTNDELMIEKYGITCEQKCISNYRSYRYDLLQDEINFAKLVHERGGENLPLDPDGNVQLR